MEASSMRGATRPRGMAKDITPPYTEELEDFRDSVNGWVTTNLLPHADEWEDSKHFPDDVFKQVASQGYLGLKFEEEYGGSCAGGPDNASDGYLADSILLEELPACGSGGVAAGLWAHAGIALTPIWKFGTPEQKQKYLAPGITGDKIAALAITEPGAGSDVASISTRADKVDGGYMLNGSKVFITNGIRAHTIVTAAKTTQDGGHHGMSFFIVERGEGVSSNPLEKLGWHASDTAEISYEDVFVPEENLLGTENEGFYMIMANFQWERLMMALGAVGAMKLVYQQTIDYAHERNAFGRPISNFQVIRHKFADMATQIEAARAITYNALRLFIEGKQPLSEVTMAKLFTQSLLVKICDECLQIHGGWGYMKEYKIERALRDARLGPIGGGTDEIMKEILGKSLGI
ncbi:MAG: acyl-CoA dehydrogenase family protein [Thermoleophilaceae bacterium]|nr:acyl-CoA dehydrogenase family protein [Thermoleophilaceae bacterium]